MTLQKGTLNGHPILEDSASVGVPVVNVNQDGGDIVAQNAATIATRRPVHICANVAAMQALVSPYLVDGQLYQTVEYTNTSGKGSNLYEYSSGSSATHDGGFVITCTAGGRFLAVDQSVADVTKFGAVGDGVADDSAALLSAMQTGKPIELVNGSTYLIGTAISYVGDVSIIGNGATIQGGATGTLILITGTTNIKDVVFDGNDFTGLERLLQLSGTGASHNTENCKFLNVDSTTFATGLAYAAVVADSIQVRSCRFESIRALKNDTAGDTNGAARGIYCAAGANMMSVCDSWFEDINSVDSVPNNYLEDADAIQLYGDSLSVKQFVSDNCFFSNVGKRCYKIQDTGVCRITNSRCESAWTAADTKAMQTFMRVFDGTCVIDNCHATGGGFQYFAYVSCDRADILSCTHTPTYKALVHSEEGAGTAGQAFCLFDAPSGSIVGCQSVNTESGLLDNIAHADLLIDHCDITTYAVNIKLRAACNATIRDTTLLQDASSPETGKQGIQVIAGEYNHLKIIRCKVSGYRDGLWIGTPTTNTAGAFRIDLVNNVFDVSDDIKDQATAAYEGNIYRKNNSFDPVDLIGAGTPESVITAPIGSTWRRTDGSTGTSTYFKESGTGNTGWVAK